MRLAIQNMLLVNRLGAPRAERAEASNRAATAKALPCRPSMQCLIWLSGAPRGVPAGRQETIQHDRHEDLSMTLHIR
jgi:hypothetical protein